MVLPNIWRKSGLRTRLSFVIAIGIVAIGALLFPGSAPTPPDRLITARVALVIARTPTPPPPTPTPPPVVHKIIAKPVIAPQHSKPAEAAPISHHKNVALRAPELSHRSTTPAIATGGIGPGGSGSAEAGSGTGAGAPPAAVPCGDVEFIAEDAVYYDRQTQYYLYDKVDLSVHFSDGTHQQVPLDYPWRYKDEAGDPFANPVDTVPILFEFPPKELRAQEPPLVQYVMAHSDKYGFTSLEACPTQ